MALERWLRRSAWRALVVDLRRAPKDAHSRTRLGRATVPILLALYFAAIEFLSFHWADSRPLAIGQLTFHIILFGGIGTYAWWSERRDKRIAEKESPSVAVEVKLAIFREALLLATLLERGASERGLEKELPPTIEVITRRVLLDRMRSEGLLESLDAHLIGLLLAPDGHWTEVQKRKAESAWEYMDVMHWALGLGDLSPLSLTPEYTIAMVRKVVDVKDAQKLSVLASWDIRPFRNDADEYLIRCWVDLVERGIVDLGSQDFEEAMEIKADIQYMSTNGDYLAGVNTIGELSNDVLWQVGLRAYRRWQILSKLVNVLCEDEPVTELHNLIAGTFFDSTEQAIAVATAPPDQTGAD